MIASMRANIEGGQGLKYTFVLKKNTEINDKETQNMRKCYKT